MLLHCAENVCCINITNHKGFLIQFNLLLLFFFGLFFSFLSSYESLALLSLWHCPAFFFSVSLSVLPSLCLSPALCLCALFLNDDTERQL